MRRPLNVTGKYSRAAGIALDEEADAGLHKVSLQSMAAPKKRISVSGPQLGLNAAFAGLHIEGLPEVSASGPVGVAAERSEGAKGAKPGRVVLRRETAHRGGKTVLIIGGFGAQHSQSFIEDLARQLRAQCGCGGTVRGREIELQGDFPSKVRQLLGQQGFAVAGER